MYRGLLEPRRLWVLVKSLKSDSPLFNALRDAEAEAAKRAKVQSVDDAINMIRRGGS